jgi:hypothetical protein
MSLSVNALRICAVMALDSATSAGGRVSDSVVDPRSLLGEDAAPSVVVLAEKGKRAIEGRDILASDHCVEMAIEIFVAKATVVQGVRADDTTYSVEYPATDAGHEARLHRLAYEIDSVLTGDAGPWAEMWRRFAVKFSDESEWVRGGDADHGRRFNALRITYPVDVIADPIRGAPLPEIWEDFLSLMESNPDTAAFGRDWRALITTPNLPAWRQAQSALGLTYPELVRIGLAPFLDHQATNTTEAAQLGEATLDPDAIVIDAQ